MPIDQRPVPRPEDAPRPTDPEEERPASQPERINEEAEQEAREEEGLPEGSAARSHPARPLEPGSIPQGREEERRGHDLPNPSTKKKMDNAVTGGPIGLDEEELHGVHDQ